MLLHGQLNLYCCLKFLCIHKTSKTSNSNLCIFMQFCLQSKRNRRFVDFNLCSVKFIIFLESCSENCSWKLWIWIRFIVFKHLLYAHITTIFFRCNTTCNTYIITYVTYGWNFAVWNRYVRKFYRGMNEVNAIRIVNTY